MRSIVVHTALTGVSTLVGGAIPASILLLQLGSESKSREQHVSSFTCCVVQTKPHQQPPHAFASRRVCLAQHCSAGDGCSLCGCHVQLRGAVSACHHLLQRFWRSHLCGFVVVWRFCLVVETLVLIECCLNTSIPRFDHGGAWRGIAAGCFCVGLTCMGPT